MTITINPQQAKNCLMAKKLHKTSEVINFAFASKTKLSRPLTHVSDVQKSN